MSEFVIDKTAVERKLSHVNVHKAPGPDWILRDFCSQLSAPLCAIFNASIREGIVPARWKEANAIPAPKAHLPQMIETDLRPISLTGTFSKLLESFVGTWILDRIKDKLGVHQYAALKGRFTTHALLDIMHHWHKVVDEGQSVRVVFIDFAKAFDHVDHNMLVAKLMEFGLPDVIVRWMCSFLCHRRQRVKIGDVMSDWLVMDAGSYLGPLTFITLIDSLRASCMTHKFVDDITLSEIVAKSDTSCMQVCCDEVVQQSEEVRMNVNGRKTKEMLIGPTAEDPPPHLLLCDATVDRVTAFKLLGIRVSSDLKWTTHVDAIVANAASRLHFIKQLKRAGAPIREHFYDANRYVPEVALYRK